jgi:hypothetical protein
MQNVIIVRKGYQFSYSPINHPDDVYLIPPIDLTHYGTVTMIQDHMNRSTRETELIFFWEFVQEKAFARFMNCNNREYNPDYSTGTDVRDHSNGEWRCVIL